MSVFMTENRLLGGLRETVAGTTEAITSGDYDVRARNVELGSLTVEFDNESSKFATGDHTRDEAIAGVTKGEISFDIKLAPGEFDTVTSAGSLQYDKYLEGAGLISEYVGDGVTPGKYVFTPGKAGDVNTCTIGLVDVESGSSPKTIEYKLGGAMSSLTIGVEGAGKPIIANLGFSGKIAGVSELSATPVYSDSDALSSIADKFFNYTVRVTDLSDDSTEEFCINSFSLESGASLNSLMCQSDASGILYDSITSRDPRITINPLLKSLTDWNFWSAINGEGVYKLEILGDQIEIVVPRGQFISPSISDDGGYLRNELVMRPLRNVEGTTQASKEAVYSISIDEIEKPV